MGYLNKPQIIASILVIIAGFCWGMIGLFSRTLSNINLNSIQISMIRSLVLALTLLSITLITDRKKLRILLKDIWIFVGSGVMSIAFFNVCYFISINENTLSLAAILLYTAPAFVIIMSRLVFGEQITRKKLSALILSVVGSIFATGLFSESISTNIYGLAVGIGSGIGYALYSIFSRIALKKYNWLTVITYTFLFATLALLPFSQAAEVFRVITTSPEVIASTLALGWVSTLLPFVLYTKALKNLEVGKAALLTFVEPVVATIIGVLAFNEVMTIFNIGGISLIILALAILNKRDVDIYRDEDSEIYDYGNAAWGLGKLFPAKEKKYQENQDEYEAASPMLDE